MDLNDLYYYAQVIENGGFAAAGRALGVPKSKLSRRIAMLEQRLGVRLINRSTRHFSVTEIGQTYYEHCKAMLVEAQAAEEAIAATHAEPCGIVRVSCPVAILHAHVGRMLAGFMASHPRVEIHLVATNRVVSPISEGIDLAIRVRPPPLEDSDFVLRVLSDRSQCIVASPRLLSERGTPAAPADLPAYPSLALGSPQDQHSWMLFGPDGAEAILRHRPRFITSDMIALRRAAVAGVGIVQLPTLMVCDELTAGTLVRLLPDWAPPREIIHAVYPSRRGLLPAVRSLIDCLASGFEAIDED